MNGELSSYTYKTRGGLAELACADTIKHGLAYRRCRVAGGIIDYDRSVAPSGLWICPFSPLLGRIRRVSACFVRLISVPTDKAYVNAAVFLNAYLGRF